MIRKYISFNNKKGYPAGANIYYECMDCGDIFPSLPQESVTCKCDNLSIDVDYGRVAVKDNDSFKIFIKE